MRWYALLLVFVLMLSGCSNKTVAPIVSVGSDKEIFVERVLDSVFVDRWHTSFLLGDTVFVRDSVAYVRWRDREVHDTIVDSIPFVLYQDRVKEVPADLSDWQRLLIAFGKLGLVLCICVLGILGVRLWLKFR